MTSFESPYALGDAAKIKASGEAGLVRAVAFHTDAPISVLLHYKAADGRATEAWWSADQVEPLVTKAAPRKRAR